MFTSLRQRARSQEGFTLVELLAVILIIGILAAIAIPSFTGQSAKANDASAKSNARNAVSQMESCFTDAQSYANCKNPILRAGGLRTPTGDTSGNPAKGQTTVSNGTLNGSEFTVIARSETNTTFSIKVAAGVTTYSCTPSGDGGCNSQWTTNGN